MENFYQKLINGNDSNTVSHQREHPELQDYCKDCDTIRINNNRVQRELQFFKAYLGKNCFSKCLTELKDEFLAQEQFRSADISNRSIYQIMMRQARETLRQDAVRRKHHGHRPGAKEGKALSDCSKNLLIK